MCFGELDTALRGHDSRFDTKSFLTEIAGDFKVVFDSLCVITAIAHVVFGIDKMVAAVGLILVTSVYTVFGGLTAVILTDVAQSVVSKYTSNLPLLVIVLVISRSFSDRLTVICSADRLHHHANHRSLRCRWDRGPAQHYPRRPDSRGVRRIVSTHYPFVSPIYPNRHLIS